jgi:hypothetical protein
MLEFERFKLEFHLGNLEPPSEDPPFQSQTTGVWIFSEISSGQIHPIFEKLSFLKLDGLK